MSDERVGFIGILVSKNRRPAHPSAKAHSAALERHNGGQKAKLWGFLKALVEISVAAIGFARVRPRSSRRGDLSVFVVKLLANGIIKQ